jgi:uncharacterized iron-regulated protein
MVEAWHARNVAMARRLAQALEAPRGAPVVVIIGRGHLEPGGVPDQLARLRPGTRQLLVDMREVGDAGPGAVEGEGASALVWVTPAAERPDYCERLRQNPQLLR